MFALKSFLPDELCRKIEMIARREQFKERIYLFKLLFDKQIINKKIWGTNVLSINDIITVVSLNEKMEVQYGEWDSGNGMEKSMIYWFKNKEILMELWCDDRYSVRKLYNESD